MKKKLKTSLFHHAACISLALMAVLLAFAACKDEPEPLSGANNITSFKIGDRLGALTRTRGETELVDQDSISVIVPATEDLKRAKPVITISGGAKVSPASEEEVDLTYPLSYVVTAENGSARFYKVTAIPEGGALESIWIYNYPAKTIYKTTEELNLNGLLVRGVYSDRSEKTVSQGDVSVTGYTKGEVGIQTLTVTVGSKTATFDVEVTDAVLDSIRISRLPTKVTYTAGEPLSLVYLEVTGNYADGTTKDLPVAIGNISGYDKDTVGIQTLTITINDKTAVFNVEVVAAEPSSITISANPNKSTYIQGEELDLTGIAVTVNYYNTSRNKVLESEDLTVEDNTIGYDKNKTGSQQVHLKIEGTVSTYYFTVNVTALAPSSVSVTRQPRKTTYLKGEDLDLTGIAVTVNYTDSSRNKVLESDELTVEDNIIGYDKTKTGSQQVYVKIEGTVSNDPLNDITVYESSPLSLSIGLPKDDNGDLNIYGIPEGGIQLSVDGRNDLPKMIVISVGAVGSSNVYSQIDWYIDGTPQNSWPNSWSNNNIVTVAAAHTNPVLALNKTHTLTVEVTKDNGVVYSQTIPFKVVK